MDKNRKTANILNVFQYDHTTGVVTLPSTLSLVAPAGGDNSATASTTAWVRTYISSLNLIGSGALSTTDVTEGTRLYYTDARVGSYLTANSFATQTYVGTQIANLVASSPATLDTLNELASALGNDPNFATTVATSIGTKQAQLNGTGFVKVTGTTVSYDNSTYLTTSNLSGYVPYTGATAAVNLGNYNLTIKEIVIGTGAKNNTNIAIGRNVMSYSSGGTGNVAIGVDALYFDQSDGSVVIGYEAGYYSNQGRNVTIGYQAGRSNGPGSNSIAVGYQALMNNTGGTRNIALGYLAGSELSGSNNTIIGGYLGTTMSSNVVIADGAGNVRFQWDGSNILLNGNTVGSNAYNSTAFLPLAGGTVTGVLSVNSALRIKSGSATGILLETYNTNELRIRVTPVSTTFDMNLVFPSSSRTYTYPNATGTIALTSDIPTVAGVYLPLSGGTLTGALTGTSANFSGSVEFLNNTRIFDNLQFRFSSVFRGQIIPYNAYGGGTDFSPFFTSETSLAFGVGGNATKVLNLASTGAATFSSSVGIGTQTIVEPLTVSFASHGLISQHRQSNGVGVGQNFYMKFNNALGNSVNYAGIYADIQANTTGAHNGRMILQVANAGNLLSAVTISNTGITTFSNNIFLGIIGGGNATADTIKVNLGSTFSNTPGSNLKVVLFNDTGSNIYGIGVSNNQMDFNIPTGAIYRFYTGAAAFNSDLYANSDVYTANALRFNGSGLNASDKKLYSPIDGELQWMTHSAAGAHAFSISHQGTRQVYLDVSGNSYLNGGNTGFGTSSPSHRIHASGNIYSTDTVFARNLKPEAFAGPVAGTPTGATIPLGYSSINISTPCDNNWRSIMSNINDVKGYFWVTLGDAASKDTANYFMAMTSPAYGVSNFGAVSYSDNGWNTGGFEFTYDNLGSGTHRLLVRCTSYYNSANTAYGTIYFLRLE